MSKAFETARTLAEAVSVSLFPFAVFRWTGVI
jgi:hypothetical protein